MLAQYHFNPVLSDGLLSSGISDINSPFYAVFSSNLTFFKHQVLSSQKLVELQLNFLPYKSSIGVSILQEKEFLMKEYFVSFVYAYFLTLNRKSKIIFSPAIHYNSQSLDMQELVFPSQLVNATNFILFDFSNYINSGIDFGLQYFTNIFNFNFKITNLALIFQKGDFGNHRQILSSQLGYKFLLNKFTKDRLKIGVGIWLYSQNYKYISLEYIQKKNYLKLQLLSNRYIPNSFAAELGFSHRNYTFVYLFWLKSIAESPARLLNNGIKIVYNIKKYKKVRIKMQ